MKNLTDKETEGNISKKKIRLSVKKLKTRQAAAPAKPINETMGGKSCCFLKQANDNHQDCSTKWYIHAAVDLLSAHDQGFLYWEEILQLPFPGTF